MQICVYMHRIELAKIAYKSEFFLHSVRQNVIENSKTIENWPKTKRRQKMKTKTKNEKNEKWKKNRNFWKKPKFLKKKSTILKISKKFKKFKNFVFCHLSKKWLFLKKSEIFEKILKFWKKLRFWKKLKNFRDFFEFHQLYLKSRQMKGKWQFEGHNTTIPRTEVRVWHDRWFHIMASCVKTAPHGDPR